MTRWLLMMIALMLVACGSDDNSKAASPNANTSESDSGMHNSTEGSDTGSCTPSCDNKVCGPDGCGGQCGSCPDGESCTTEGSCETGCAPGEELDGGTCVCKEGFLAWEDYSLTCTRPGCFETTGNTSCPPGFSGSPCRCPDGLRQIKDEDGCNVCEEPPYEVDPGDTIGRSCSNESDCAAGLTCLGGTCVCCEVASVSGDTVSCVETPEFTRHCADKPFGGIGNVGAGCFLGSASSGNCVYRLTCMADVAADDFRCGCCVEIDGTYTCSQDFAFVRQHCITD